MTGEDWVKVFVDPSPRQRALRTEDPSVVAFAYLLDGNLDDYRQRAQAAGLPDFGGSDAEPNSGLAWIVHALHSMLQGNPVAIEELRRARTGPRGHEFAAMSVVLESVLLSDAGRPDLSVRLLRDELSSVESPLERQLLVCQLGLRAGEAGEFEPLGAPIVPDDLQAGPEEYALGLIAEHNDAQLAWYSRQEVRRGVRSRSTSYVLARLDGSIVDALSSYLKDAYNSFFDSPFTRTYSFGAVDKTDQGLSRVLLRSEILGDWTSVTSARAMLGEYRLMADAGRPTKAGAFGFSLLRRSRSARLIGKAVQLFRAIGPLEALKEAGLRSTNLPWFPLDLREHLKIIEGSAITLDTDAAGKVAARLIENFDSLSELVPGAGWVVGDVIDTLAAVTPMAPVEMQDEVAALVLNLARQEPDTLLHQSLPTLVHSIPWTNLAKRRRTDALEFLESSLEPPTERIFVAMALARELYRVSPKRVSRALLAAYGTGGSPGLGAMLMELSVPLPADVRGDLEARLISTLQGLRDAAHQGSYSLGVLNASSALTALAIRARSRAAFDAVVSFALDPQVPPDERARVASILARNHQRVPKFVARRLRNGLPRAATEMPLMGTQLDLDVANIELALAFANDGIEAVIPSLLALASSDDSGTRLATCRAVVGYQSSIPEDTYLALMLGLAADRQPNVRAAAGYGLASALLKLVAAEHVALSKLRALAAEPGEAVPAAVWSGLAAAVASGWPLPDDLRSQAEFVAGNHVAATVRRSARVALQSVSR